MKLQTVSALLALAIVSAAHTESVADVTRPAPNFVWGAGSTAGSLKGLKGQPVVLVVAPSPRSGKFRKQAKEIERDYQGFASRNTVFVVAFTEPFSPSDLKSSVPFVIANNSPEIAASYAVTKGFSVAVIGTDGNLDLQTAKIAPTHKLRDAILNSFELQSAERRP